MNTNTMIGVGLRETNKGKFTVVILRPISVSMYGLKGWRVRHQGIKTFKDKDKAETIARETARDHGVPFVGFSADQIENPGSIKLFEI